MKGSVKIGKRLAGLHYEAGKLPEQLRNSDAFWALPHQLRRMLFYTWCPSQCLSSYKLKYSNKIEEAAFDLKSFLDTKSLFLHIPKAAGISIVNGLYGRKTGDHRTMQDYSLVFTKTEFDSLFKFTFIRNPWDRVYSAYKFLAAGGRNEFDAMWFRNEACQYDSFNEFVKNWICIDNINKSLHFKSQSDFIMHGNVKIDFIGRYENLENDYEKLRDKLSIGKTLPSLNRNKKREKDYRLAYDEESIECVRNVYRRDIEGFSYTF